MSIGNLPTHPTAGMRRTLEAETRFDAIVVGAGPAGCATAIQLARNRPERADRVLLLDAAIFPRDKLCGGGLVRESDRLLEHLGVADDVPSVSIDTVRLVFEDDDRRFRRPRSFRVVRREEFDCALVEAAAARGVGVRQGEPVLRLEREEGGIRISTPLGEYRAPIVVGADGAGSRVRRKLVGPACGERFVALEIFTDLPEPALAHTAFFDFRPAAGGLRGYAWDFPSRRGEQWIVNRGIGGSRWDLDRSLRQYFEDALMQRGIELRSHALHGWSAPLYHPDSPQSAPHVLLAGDAVGIDPWLGEGISVALGSGILAANAATEALADGDFSFAGYAERLRDSGVGWQLCRKRQMADPFYDAVSRVGPGTVSLDGAPFP